MGVDGFLGIRVWLLLRFSDSRGLGAGKEGSGGYEWVRGRLFTSEGEKDVYCDFYLVIKFGSWMFFCLRVNWYV